MADLEDLNAINVLLVEDDEGDALIIREAFEYYRIRNRLTVVSSQIRPPKFSMIFRHMARPMPVPA